MGSRVSGSGSCWTMIICVKKCARGGTVQEVALCKRWHCARGGPSFYQFSPLNAAYPSTPRPTSNSARSLKFDISSTTKALQAPLCFPALSDSIDYVQTTKEYRGDDTTLRRRHQGKQVSGHKATFESKYLLKDAPEQASFTYRETFRALDSSTPQMARNFTVENEKKAGERAGFMR